jgi:hypothetical protein
MGDRGTVQMDAEPVAYATDGRSTSFVELQARLARAYLSGNGAEVERVLALVSEANYVLPPKTDRAA